MAREPVDFNREIRPILSENCYFCHGQDPKERKADLRLDSAEEAQRDLGGYAAIVPGKPDNSELVLRILSHDPDEQMPPKKSNRHLTPEQIETLKQWIAEGAHYERHWAFLPPRRPALPSTQDSTWARSGVDRFILARLEREGLKPAPSAAPETWLRRATLDLTGLPPTPAEVDAFLSDVATRGDAAYETVADRLLTSPRFGERMAVDWLDAARYADTHGFNNDSMRSMWRWRDWVIDAFNSNLPYNRFITEQLAGDLLPNPTVEQRIATGFCRNHVINSEGGIIDEEYRVEYVADRVRTMSTAWLGLTFECARCHDHKFDPLTQRDYYSLYSLFNNVPEHGEDGRVANAVPMIPAPTREQQQELSAQQSELRRLDEQLDALRAKTPEQEGTATALPAVTAPDKDLTLHISCDDTTPVEKTWSLLKQQPQLVEGVTGQAWKTSDAAPLAKIESSKINLDKDGLTVAMWIQPEEGNPRDVALLSNATYSGSPAQQGFGRGHDIRLIDGEIEVRINEFFPAYAIRVHTESAKIRPGQWRHVTVAYGPAPKASDIRVFVDGRELATQISYDGLPGRKSLSAPYLLGADGSKDAPAFHGSLDELHTYGHALDTAEIYSLFASGALPYATRRAEQGTIAGIEKEWLREAALRNANAEWAKLTAEREQIWTKHLALRRSLPTAMVMQELPEPRPAFVLQRGRYDAHGEQVHGDVPAALQVPWPADAPRNRLGLAQWLTQPNHPLTSRVVVNRLWAQLFGTGLVKTLEDFGSQGEYPSHPELLDWLACEFMDSGWNVKALFRTLVLSSVYRQSSRVEPELLAKDPENRLLARAPRLRLTAETLRDQALAISGLLRERIGGPSVYPYQPEGLYNGVVVGADYPGTKWLQSKGDDLFRRSLYTFWKRTLPHPVMSIFDAPEREFCTVRRSRTNTPLQALVLMNEPGFLQAARELGKRMQKEGGTEDEQRIRYAFRLATGRVPHPEEARELQSALTAARQDFSASPEAAKKFLAAANGDAASPDDAACATVASIILNLDETVTRE